MNESSIQCIGGVLFGLRHSSYVDEFIYSDPNSRKYTQYTKKIMHGQVFFVAEGIDSKFAEQLALQLLK
ncbi:hypothetical protein [Acinetobacter sp. WCHAc060025]|uniref:hypothetical protein n=1 Tax=Acinetobacter sp. WCHAc060025 TaxID=2518625 RepID=UPI001023C3A6|nr:hypothetical protein [Acinetobacter sp. WCHAc060025]RZG76212.1 hypothetical protein EXE09_08115 [Acinetobacter sp. WCHAc060025]